MQEILLILLGSALTFLGGVISPTIQDRRNRRYLAVNANRNFQRDTLLEIQEVAVELRHSSILLLTQGKRSEEVVQDLRTKQGSMLFHMAILRERIDDSELRTQLNEYANWAVLDKGGGLTQASLFAHINTIIGTLLRGEATLVPAKSWWQFWI